MAYGGDGPHNEEQGLRLLHGQSDFEVCTWDGTVTYEEVFTGLPPLAYVQRQEDKNHLGLPTRCLMRIQYRVAKAALAIYDTPMPG